MPWMGLPRYEIQASIYFLRLNLDSVMMRGTEEVLLIRMRCMPTR